MKPASIGQLLYKDGMGSGGREEVLPEIVEAARRGERSAFEALFRLHAPAALGLAFAWTRDQSLAEEAVQEALARAWARLESLRDPARFAPWFWRIVLNCARDAVRSESRARMSPANWTPGLSNPENADPSGRTELIDALRMLPADLRAAVCLRYIADLPEEEAARALGWRRGTLKSRLHRARRLLARTLSIEEGVSDERS